MTDKPGQTVSAEAAESALLRELSALPKAIQPANDPWQHISRRIAGEQSGQADRSPQGAGLSHRGWLALAASVTLVAVTSLFMMQRPAVPVPAELPMAAVDEAQSVGNGKGAPLPTSSVELEYQAAFREFVRLDMSQATLSDNTRDAIVQDWDLMRQLEQDLLLALEQEPENPLLLDRWMKLRASQLQLLHVIAETGQLPGRTLI